MGSDPEVTALISREVKLIRENVPGVRGAITATSDGLLVAQDVPDLEATQIAALVAALHSVAKRASLTTDCGELKEVVTRGSDGYLAVYAVGSVFIVAVLGTPELNVAMLNFRARTMIDRIGAHSAGLVRQPRTHSSGGLPGREDARSLPSRRLPS